MDIFGYYDFKIIKKKFKNKIIKLKSRKFINKSVKKYAAET